MGKFILILLFTAISLLCSAQKITRLDGSTVTEQQLDNKISQLMRDAAVAGVTVTLFTNNNPVYHKAFGHKDCNTSLPLTTATNIYGASLSKAVFAVLVLKLVEEGVISLDEPLQHYLPQPVYEYGKGKSWNQDYTSLKEEPLYKKITARQCLSHSSGWYNWRWFEPDQKLHVHFEPGSNFLYSGEGICYLQFVIEKLTGKSLNELMQEKLFGPLGMKHSSYTWQPEYEADYCVGYDTAGKCYPKDKDNAPRAASTLETTPDDYKLFTTSVLQRKILKPATYDTLFKQQLRVKNRSMTGTWEDTVADNDAIRLGYALGWGRFETPFGYGVFKEGHGDGFQHYTVLFPEKKLGIVIMTNSDNGESIFKELLEFAIGDRFTPWKWENYVPYNQK